MKHSTLVILTIILLSPFFASAQSMMGDWAMKGKSSDGADIINKVSFMEDGTMTVDFGNNGTVNVMATYTDDGKQVSISDTSDESPCKGKVGVYAYSIEGDIVTVKVVSDPCDERRGDGKAGTMTRMK